MVLLPPALVALLALVALPALFALPALVARSACVARRADACRPFGLPTAGRAVCATCAVSLYVSPRCSQRECLVDLSGAEAARADPPPELPRAESAELPAAPPR